MAKVKIEIEPREIQSVHIKIPRRGESLCAVTLKNSSVITFQGEIAAKNCAQILSAMKERS